MKLLLQVSLICSGVAVVVWLGLTFAGKAANDVPEVPLTPAERGRELAAALGCVACHSLDGAAGIGPSWRSSYGALRTFTDGSSARVDEAYLRRAMREPAVQVVAGYQNVMLPAALTDSQIDDIIALLRELAGQ
jgi:cytochrome c oxidase subunit 2